MFTFRLRLLVLLAVVLLVGCSTPGAESNDASSSSQGNLATKSVHITLKETHLVSDVSTFTLGTPYDLLVTNSATVSRAFFILPPDPSNTLRSFDEMQKHALAQVRPLEPGTTKTLHFTFSHDQVMQYGMSLEGFLFVSAGPTLGQQVARFPITLSH